jgi:hypothetical protein
MRQTVVLFFQTKQSGVRYENFFIIMDIFEIDDILFKIFDYLGDCYFLPTFFVNKRFNLIANEIFLPHLYVVFHQNRLKWERKNIKYLSIVRWCLDELKMTF